MENFVQSLKPLTVLMKFIVGVNLDNSDGKQKIVRFLVPAFGFLVIICHLIINGPCGLYSFTRRYLQIKDSYIALQPETIPIEHYGIALLIGDICRFPLFFSTPITHFIFVAAALMTRKWEDLCDILRKINYTMKLSKEFHGKLRRQCLVALSLLVLVNSDLEIRFHDQS